MTFDLCRRRGDTVAERPSRWIVVTFMQRPKPEAASAGRRDRTDNHARALKGHLRRCDDESFLLEGVASGSLSSCNRLSSQQPCPSAAILLRFRLPAGYVQAPAPGQTEDPGGCGLTSSSALSTRSRLLPATRHELLSAGRRCYMSSAATATKHATAAAAVVAA